ncbi:unnamed protein product, partial [Didymodactylos carnosus]
PKYGAEEIRHGTFYVLQHDTGGAQLDDDWKTLQPTEIVRGPVNVEKFQTTQCIGISQDLMTKYVTHKCKANTVFDSRTSVSDQYRKQNPNVPDSDMNVIEREVEYKEKFGLKACQYELQLKEKAKTKQKNNKD